MSGLEIIGLVASVLGIIDVTKNVLGSAVAHIAAVKGHEGSINTLQTALQSMGSTLSDIDDLIDETDDKSDKCLKRILQGRGADVGELKRCEVTLKELELFVIKHKLSGTKVGRWSRMKTRLQLLWNPISEAEIGRFTSRLDTHRANLTLTVGVDSNRQITAIGSRLTATHMDAQLMKLPYAENAAYNHGLWEHEDRCLRGTRVVLLDKIKKWYEDPHSECIFWLQGMAGTGKSTMSRTVAYELAKQKRPATLAASFFFSRGQRDISDAKKFFTTIAMQLANSLPEIRPLITKAIEENFDIDKRGLSEQWQHLIFNPLREAPAQSTTLVLVIDALDECDKDADVQLILRLLAKTKNLNTIRFKIFITSRPETPILAEFRQMTENTHQDLVLHQIDSFIVNHDISVFLQYKLSQVKAENGLRTPWPDEPTIQLLVERADRLFIYAATIYRFIKDGVDGPEEQLSLILRETATEPVIAHLDDMYQQLLLHSVLGKRDPRDHTKWLERFRLIAGSIMVMLDVMPAEALAKLLEIRDVRPTLHSLRSVLNVPEIESQPVRIFHPSFREFLLEKQRCTDPRFLIHGKESHITLFRNCMRLISEIKPNVCNLQEPQVSCNDISQDVIQSNIPTHIQYACRYWASHFKQGNPVKKDTEVLLQFLTKHLLPWLEVLCIIGEVSTAVVMIADSEEWLKDESHDVHGPLQGDGYGTTEKIIARLYDARRFILSNRVMIERTPLQLYHSALLFSPINSLVRKQYYSGLPYIQREPIVLQEWSPLIQTFEGHSGVEVGAIMFSPDGKLVASASDDNTVRLWDTATGGSCRVLEGHSAWVTAVVFSPNGKLVASGSYDKTVRLWDTATGGLCRVLEGHSNEVIAVVFSPDGKLVASASDDNTVRLWDTATGGSCRVLEGHSAWVRVVVFSPNGKLVASGSYDKTVRLWDTATGGLCRVLEGHSNEVNAVVFSPNGKLVASGAYDKTVRLWDTATGGSCRVLEGHSLRVMAVVFSPDGKLVASASDDNTVRLWDTATGGSELCGVLEGHSDDVNAVVFSPNGKLVASGSYDKTVRLWDTATGGSCWVLEGHLEKVNAVMFSPDGKLVASASGDKTVRLWDTATGVSKSCRVLEGHLAWVTAVVFSPDGQLVASASGDNTVRLWDAATGGSCRVLEGHIAAVLTVVFSPNGQLVASASGDTTVRLWDTATGVSKSCRVLEGHSNWVMAVVFSPDGQLVASASYDNTVRLWDTATGGSCRVLKGHRDWVTAVVFSPDGQLVASASYDNTVRLWDTATGGSCGVLKGHMAAVLKVVFSPDGKLVASASDDQTVAIWSVAQMEVIEAIRTGGPTRIRTLGFHGAHVYTNRGMFSLTSHLYPCTMTQMTVSPRLIITDEWVIWGTKKILSLPIDHRPNSSAVEGNCLVMGYQSGRVVFITFDLTAFSNSTIISEL